MLPPEVRQVVAHAHARHSPITLVTGVFDLLHAEHLRFLKKAKELGGVLIVGVESDVRVRQMKGPGRPVNDQLKRCTDLTNTRIPDQVFILPEQFSQPADHERLIAEVRPKYLAVSSHTAHQENKRRLLAKYGGEVVVVHEHNPSISTSKLLQ